MILNEMYAIIHISERLWNLLRLELTWYWNFWKRRHFVEVLGQIWESPLSGSVRLHPQSNWDLVRFQIWKNQVLYLVPALAFSLVLDQLNFYRLHFLSHIQSLLSFLASITRNHKLLNPIQTLFFSWMEDRHSYRPNNLLHNVWFWAKDHSVW